MALESLKNNLEQMKNIIREIYTFKNQLDIINNLEATSQVIIESREKKLLENAITALTNQLKILNNSIPELTQTITFYSQLSENQTTKPKQKLIQVKYQPTSPSKNLSLTITEKDRKKFLENISMSNLSIEQLRKKYRTPKPPIAFGKPNAYAKLSNRFFRKYSYSLISKGYFLDLNKDLRKINSPFVLGTYLSMMLLTTALSIILTLTLFTILLFFIPITKIFWLFLIPLVTPLLLYLYPSSEAKNIGSRIDQELPFIVIHISAIATSGIEPTNIFKILLKSEEYKYTNREFKKIMNLVNLHGKDLITALKEVSYSSPSSKLSELLNGIATSITSGGNLHEYLNKHAETLLFDYRLEREKSTRVSETFMDIYIAVVIAAPMILLLIFVIMGSLGTLVDTLGLSTNMVSLIIILIISLINIFFLLFLKVKQPTI